MSQSGVLSVQGGMPTVPTSFATDDGSATPSGNTLNVLGSDTTENNDNGLQTSGSGATVTVELTNRATATTTTTDATLTTIISLPMGGTAGTIYVNGSVQAFESTTPASATFAYAGGYRTDGAAAIELGTEFHDTFQDPLFAASDIYLSTSGNNILVQIEGIAATTIKWNAVLEFRIVTV